MSIVEQRFHLGTGSHSKYVADRHFVAHVAYGKGTIKTLGLIASKTDKPSHAKSTALWHGLESLQEFILALEQRGELLRVSHPVDVELEAGCIADLLVKRAAKHLSSISQDWGMEVSARYPLAMNLFGTRDRTNLALGVVEPKEIGEIMTGLMKPDMRNS